MKDEHFTKFQLAVNKMKQSEEAKRILLQNYMPNVMRGLSSEHQNHIGSGFYGQG